MHILTRWNYRMVRANRSRTITVFFAVVGFFALWVCADFVVTSTVYGEGIRETGSIGIRTYLFNYIRMTNLFEGVFLWAKNILENISSGTLFNNPFFRALINYLSFGLLLVMAAVTYSVFSVTSDETLRDFRILKAAGTTVRQMRRTLLLRAVVLDLVGAVIGTVLGLFAAWLSLGVTAVRNGMAFARGTAQFVGGLPVFFRDPRTVVSLALSLLIVPCMMAIAAARTFRHSRKESRQREAKHGMIRPQFTWRVFGMGGVLAGISGEKNRRCRAIFMVSFAVCIAVLALLDNLLLLLQNTQPIRDDYDLSVECYDYGVDSPVSGTDVLRGVLQNGSDRLRVESSATMLEPYDWQECSYVLLDCDWLADPVTLLDVTGEIFTRDDRSFRLYKFPFRYAFLDDASFARLALDCGIEETQTDGAILYSPREPDVPNFGEMDFEKMNDDWAWALHTRLNKVDPARDVTLHFVPYSFLYTPEESGTNFTPVFHAPDEEFLRAADPESVTETFRILALTQSLPYPFEASLADSDFQVLLFPERMYASFAQTLSGVDTDSDYPWRATTRTVSFYHLQNAETGCETFRNAVKTDRRLEDREHVFGVGTRWGSEDEEEWGEYDPRLARVEFTDLHDAREKLNVFRSAVPGMRRILLAMVVWILFVGVLNTAHMNRMTRRCENAILESIGLDRRQKTGMLLYESALYALCGALLGWVGFLLLFFPVWKDFQELLESNELFARSERVSMWDNVFRNVSQEDWGRMLLDFAKSYARTWWIFVVGGVLIFVMMVVTDRMIDRRSAREELIQILKDDSADNYG